MGAAVAATAAIVSKSFSISPRNARAPGRSRRDCGNREQNGGQSGDGDLDGGRSRRDCGNREVLCDTLAKGALRGAAVAATAAIVREKNIFNSVNLML